jgi:hypothetical protein
MLGMGLANLTAELCTKKDKEQPLILQKLISIYAWRL